MSAPPVELLACPACRGGLRELSNCLVCADCGEGYPVVNGIPVLMTPADRGRFGTRLEAGEGAAMAERYTARKNSGLKAGIKRLLTPPLPLIHNPAEPRLSCQPGSLNLFIGGGGSVTPGFVNLDVGSFPGVDIVSNTERLPFRDCTLDAIECDAVLEHVERPETAACEMFRVLRPGGVLHAVVPFCHPYHAYPSDFRRWTAAGFAAWLVQFGFEVSASGVRTGAAATLLTFTLEYMKVLFGTGTAGKAAYAALGWLLFPLRYLDLWTNRTERAALLANHVFALARKPESHTRLSTE